ncbi:hypothetical protein DL96DRAFT_308292 [Flagelloscypha sp. PMI_526]|nr:hypothetical protein DL96DRAFT_308292 [Flagelloscypha sp. PMI_526]
MEAASAALSLVDVALRLGKYISETLEYSKERAAFQLELSQLAALLRRFAQHKHSGSPDDALVIELRGIQNNVEKLHKKLFAEVGLGKVHRQLRWPFVKKEILEITGRIERAKTFLILILSNDIGQEIEVERTRAQSRHADITKQLTDLTVNTTRARAVAESLKVQSFPSVSPKDVMLLQTEQAEARRARIAEQISAFDQRENHARVLSQVQTEAGLWFIQQLDGWMEHSSQIVWATGIPGGGKTSLTAVAIEHIKKRKKAAETFVGYIYLKFSVKMSLQDIFASLERQTVEQGASISQTQALGHSNARSLSGRLGSFARSYIIVDALDEYPDGVGRLELVDDLTELVVNNGVNLLLTSRPVIAKDRFDERIQWMEIRAHDEDLVPYIERQLGGARLKRLLKGNETLREEIKGVLLRQNEGMFLLPRLHLDLLSRCRSLAELRRTLQKLPDSVFDTVQQSLQRIREQDPGDAHLAELVLAWTVFSRRHLTLSELQSAVAACDIHSTTWSELQEAITDEGLLVDVCLGLVDVQEAHGIKEPLVSMTHFTIQQFFDMFGLEQFPWAHVQITNACLRHMTLHPLFNDLGSFNVDFDPEASFSHYAAVEWGHHGRAVEDDPTFLDSVVSFSYRETCVAKAGQILLEHDRSSLLAYPEAAPSTSLAVSGITPLHLTVYFNCLSLLIYQLSTSSAKLWIDAPDHQSRTPLWYAARLGLTDIVTTLLEHEASPNIAEKNHWFHCP